ncbi:YHS domain-containing (seleno)protein [Marinibacterium profundimaris]|nr:YHS domain-containing (seleno)protein [Marinibacterium profundimaris]
MNRRQFLVSGLAAGMTAGLATSLSVVGTPAQAGRAMFCTIEGLAIDGYDPVSYFSTQGPRRGRRDISVMWKGAIWRFATPKHRDMFELNPWALAPRYGAYCAYAMSQGILVPGSPRVWHLVNGRLYLTQDVEAHERWRKDMVSHIAKADVNWPAILLTERS